MAPANATLKFVAADFDFIPAYDIKMVAGRNFSRDFGADTSSFILNESAVSAIGF
jgi:putative ABC transport system permease protein